MGKKRRADDDDDSDEDQSDDVSPPPSKKQKKSKSKKKRKDSDDNDDDSSSGSSYAPAERSSSKKTRRRVTTRSSAKKPVPAKRRGGGVSGSDDDSDTGSMSFDDGFDSDFMGDEDDRNRLNAMTEMERELIIAERAELRQQKRELYVAQRAVAKRDEQERAAEARTSGTKNSLKQRAMSQLKAQREKKQKRKEESLARKAAAAEAEDGEVSDGPSSSAPKGAQTPGLDKTRVLDEDSESESSSRRSDSEDDEEDEEDDEERRDGGDDDDEDSDGAREATCAELNTIRLQRALIEKWIYEPFLADVVTGAFVRVSLGAVPGGAVHYRMYEIMSLKPTKTYTLGKELTNLGLLLRHGKAEKTVRMDIVSNGYFTEEEYEAWKRGEVEAKRRPVTLKRVKDKRKRLQEATDHLHTDAEISAIVEARKKFQKDVGNSKNKSELILARTSAMNRGDQAAVARLTEQIEELEKAGSGASSSTSKGLVEVAGINERARMRNAANQNVEARKIAESQAAGLIQQKPTDVFERRSSNPDVFWGSGKNAVAPVAAPPPPKIEPVKKAKVEAAVALEKAHKAVADDDDWEIDLDSIPSAPAIPLLKKTH